MPPTLLPLPACLRARRPGRPLAVYLLRYDDSFESDRYQAAVVRERQVGAGGLRRAALLLMPLQSPAPCAAQAHAPSRATPPAPLAPPHCYPAAQVFEGLIKGKEVMILPMAADRQLVRACRQGQGRQQSSRAGGLAAPPVLATPGLMPHSPAPAQVDPGRRLPSTHADEAALLLGPAANALTRRGGLGRSARPTPKRVVVDVREFASSLPSVLHQQGLEVVPLTLEVSGWVLAAAGWQMGAAGMK